MWWVILFLILAGFVVIVAELLTHIPQIA